MDFIDVLYVVFVAFYILYLIRATCFSPMLDDGHKRGEDTNDEAGPVEGRQNVIYTIPSNISNSGPHFTNFYDEARQRIEKDDRELPSYEEVINMQSAIQPVTIITESTSEMEFNKSYGQLAPITEDNMPALSSVNTAISTTTISPNTPSSGPEPASTMPSSSTTLFK